MPPTQTKPKLPDAIAQELEGIKRAILAAVEAAKSSAIVRATLDGRANADDYDTWAKTHLAARGFGIVAPDGRVICIHRDAKRGELFPSYEAGAKSFKIAPQKTTRKRKGRR